jgi:formylmethanofuran dehydrogenase subunit E
MNQFRIKAIGIIHSPYKTVQDAPRQGKDEIIQIEIDEAFAEGLKDIERFSHLHIFYFLHRSEGYTLTTTTPGDPGPHGIFATRSPHRPTALGYAVVELLERKGNTLVVKGLDAIDGTPVIDIKPYSPGIDARPRANRGWFEGKQKGFTPRVYTWKTFLKWTEGKEGVLYDEEKKDVRIGCPPEFGGRPSYWSPEHLFVSSVDVCVLTTFLDLLLKEGLEINGYESRAEGNAQLMDGKFRFTEITVAPVVLIGDNAENDRIEQLLEQAKERCLVSNSIMVKVTMKPEIRRG